MTLIGSLYTGWVNRQYKTEHKDPLTVANITCITLFNPFLHSNP